MVYLPIVWSIALFSIVSCVRIYEQCGGEGFRGSTACDAGLQCYRRSKWFSSCQTSCPAGWECVSTGQGAGGVAKPWDQCGGQGWKGAARCSGGQNCYARSTWYSQCRPSCPSDWLCAGTSPSVVTNPPTQTTRTVSDPTTSATVFGEFSSSTAFPSESAESSNEEEQTDDDDYLDDVDGFYDDPDEEFDSAEEEIDFDAMIFDSSDEKDIGGTGLSAEITEEEGSSRRRRRQTDNDLTATQLAEIMPKCAHPEYLSYINQAMREGEIQTCYDRAAFLAQIAHESGQLNTFLEKASGEEYEGNKILGNTEPGDGPKYRGRGALQITGRWNYKAAGKALGLDLIKNADSVLEPEVAFRTSAWFWKTFKISSNARLGTETGFKAATKRINHAMNGYSDRKKYWMKAKQVLKCNGTKGREEEESNYGTCEYEGQTGLCKEVEQCTDGFNVKNLCPKGTNVQCCIPNSTEHENQPSTPSCSVNGDEGRCLSTTNDVCNGQFFTGYCKGLPRDIKCCIESEYGKCEHGNTPGLCRHKDTCTTGNLIPGLCPGNADVQCCLQRATSTAPTDLDETCDGYETAKTVQLQGSYSDKEKKTPGFYNVVKIQAKHLTVPAWAEGTYNDHDIMIEPKAACAFVRMLNAARKDNMTLKITSGFRTFERQESLYKALPAGQAAKPGRSNHGYGKALDLNADCRLKGQKKQNPKKKPCEKHPVYQWLIKNAERYGFRRTVPHESWHFDYLE